MSWGIDSVSLGAPFQGSLFADDFLRESIVETRDWEAIDDTALNGLDPGLKDP